MHDLTLNPGGYMTVTVSDLRDHVAIGDASGLFIRVRNEDIGELRNWLRDKQRADGTLPPVGRPRKQAPAVA